MSSFRLPLGLSLAAHALILAWLFMLPAPPMTMAPPAAGGIEVTVAPSLPQPPAPPPVAPETPPPPPPPPKIEPPPPPRVETPPPPPIAPPPPAPEATADIAEPLPPPPKPPVPRWRPPVQHAERQPPRESPEQPRPALAALPPSALAPPAPSRQAVLGPAPARVAAPSPAAVVSPGYAALLGAWLNSHKRYPETARERGEEGRVVLHFGVERSGRVTEFAVVRSSGYPDLDVAVEEMMRGATLPGFPADMPQSTVSVTVTLRFSLEQ